MLISDVHILSPAFNFLNTSNEKYEKFSYASVSVTHIINLVKDKIWNALSRTPAQEVQNLESQEALELAHERYNTNSLRWIWAGIASFFLAFQILFEYNLVNSKLPIALSILAVLFLIAATDLTTTLEYIEKEIDKKN